MKRDVWTLGAVCVCFAAAFLIPSGSTAQLPYEDAVEVEPSQFDVFIMFLTQAKMAYEHDGETFARFCQDFSIDPAWPSAELLAGLSDTYFQNYRSLVASSADDIALLDSAATLTEEFGQVFAQMKVDGFRLSVDTLFQMIDARIRPGMTQFSDGLSPEDLATRSQRNSEFSAALALIDAAEGESL